MAILMYHNIHVQYMYIMSTHFYMNMLYNVHVHDCIV